MGIVKMVRSGETLNGTPRRSESHHLITHDRSRHLLILLSATGTKPSHFNLWKLADQLPYHKLYLRVPVNDWYQNGVPGLGSNLDETFDSIRRLADGLKVKRIGVCGSSMGGYAALLFAAKLGGAALAFSPETRLGLPYSRSLKMMPPGTPHRYGDLHDILAGAKEKLHIYTGEMDPVDLYCAALVKKLDTVNIVTLRNDEHTVMRNLNFSDRLVPAIRAMTEGQPMPTLVDRGNALEIKEFPRSFFRGWVHYLNKDYVRARAELENALSQYPISARVNYLMARLNLKEGHPERAREHAAMAAALTPDFVEHRSLFAHCLRMTGDLEEAAFHHRIILEKWPDYHPSHFDLAQICNRLDDKEAAKAGYAEAFRLQPSNATYRRMALKG